MRADMTRYFFDFLTGDVLSLDDHGTELPNIQAAHSEALSALADAIQDVVLQGLADQRFAVNVRDERGQVLEITAALNSKVLRRL
jgi:hypothetical protein